MAVTPPTIEYACFHYVPTYIPIYVPCESEAAYQAASRWNNFTNYTGFTDTTFINAVITAGETYTQNGFNESTAGTYTQTLQSINGCDSVVVLNLSVVTNGLNTVETTDFAIFPNPTHKEINIACDEKINNIEVVDLLGKVVYQGNKTVIDVSNLARGNYFVRIYTNKGTITKKVIME
ncbi:MAG: T9SS type A sorting domain-containing protein [Bacteroidales bacterium]|nr:T9SS type A sorting domain-containing protein [Bacteroidales bacterium]